MTVGFQLQATECVGRSTDINQCPNPIFKVGKYTDNQGNKKKRMFCVCQADFSALTNQPVDEAQALQQRMEKEIWANKFQLTVDEFITLINR